LSVRSGLHGGGAMSNAAKEHTSWRLRNASAGWPVWVCAELTWVVSAMCSTFMHLAAVRPDEHPRVGELVDPLEERAGDVCAEASLHEVVQLEHSQRAGKPSHW
jgi:hypothetical protein